MNKKLVWVAVMGMMSLAACTDEPNQTDDKTVQPLITDSQAANIPEVTAEEHFPEPGVGTITSNTETPLKKQNQALYKSADGSAITAVYYFDKDNNGVVVLQNGKTDDVTLKQIKDDMPSNTASYTDGKIEWMAASSYAILANGDKQTEYKLISMQQ